MNTGFARRWITFRVTSKHSILVFWKWSFYMPAKALPQFNKKEKQANLFPSGSALWDRYTFDCGMNTTKNILPLLLLKYIINKFLTDRGDHICVEIMPYKLLWIQTYKIQTIFLGLMYYEGYDIIQRLQINNSYMSNSMWSDHRNAELLCTLNLLLPSLALNFHWTALYGILCGVFLGQGHPFKDLILFIYLIRDLIHGSPM